MTEPDPGPGRGHAAARRSFVELTGIEHPTVADLAAVPEDVAEAVVDASGEFDADWYAARHDLVDPVDILLVVDDLESTSDDELDDSHAYVPLTAWQHYRRLGVPALAAPREGFDAWWYSFHHLPADGPLQDPLLHHVLVGPEPGAETGTAPSLPAVDRVPSAPFPEGGRRACLLTLGDRDGIVDDVTAGLVEALARRADVFVLVDGVLEADQRARLESVASGVWAYPHGSGAFAAQARLARSHVGPDTLDGYDEVLLADDSAYLVGDLDPVLDRMARADAGWWALSSSGLVTEDGEPRSDVELEELGPDELGMFRPAGPLLGFRASAWRDPGLVRMLDLAVTGSPLARPGTARRGAARLLLAGGHRFASYLGVHQTEDPLLSDRAFALVADGLPFLASGLFRSNPQLVPGLTSWQQSLRASAPDAPVAVIEQNLRRNVPDDALRRSMAVELDEEGLPRAPELLEPAALVDEDRWAPKFDHWWAFPVCAFTHQISGNERAVFEHVADDPSIKKVVLTRSRPVHLTGENVVVVPLASPEGQQLLLRCGQVFVKHGARINVPYRLLPQRRNFINLWHGVPLKRFGLASLGIDDVRDKLLLENARSRAVIASSRVDRLAMTAAFEPLTRDQVWVTGLPRYDFVRCPEDALPADLARQLDTVRTMADGRRLVMYCPTFRDAQEDGYYSFSDAELAWLGEWQRRHGAVLGVREHMADTSLSYSRQLAPLGVLDLSSGAFPDVEVLYRAASALVSDYSSCLVDFMSLKRPVISFAYDHDHYAHDERGLFYDLADVLPGPVCRDFASLADALDTVFDEPGADERARYDLRAGLFFDHDDDRNASRVVARVKELYSGALS